jgi:hypothetical protein
MPATNMKRGSLALQTMETDGDNSTVIESYRNTNEDLVHMLLMQAEALESIVMK